MTTVTEIAVAGANCPWCLNETLDVLRREPGVVSVAADLGGPCLRIEHDGPSVERLLALIRDHLHAESTSSFEQVMVAVDPQVAELHCSHGTEG